MMRTRSPVQRMVLMTVVLGAFAAAAAGAKLPKIEAAVEFEPGARKLTSDNLRGKGALIIFFQSWCPICNGWAGRLFQQVQEAHGANPGLMLIAIKTDGGGVKGAEKYLESKGADLNQWFVGGDTGAKYYKAVSGGNALYGYVLVNTEGDIVGQGQAGAYYTTGPDKDKFMLADKSLVRKVGKLQTLLPAGGRYPGRLIKIARQAELGDLGTAMKECAMAASRSAHKAEAAAMLEQFHGAVKARLESAAAVLNDGQKDWGSRYEAYKTLAALTAELAGQPVVAEARALVLKMGRDPAIRQEDMAEKDYHRLMIRLDKASDRSKASIAKELKRAGERYPDTRYGKRAVEEAGRILGP